MSRISRVFLALWMAVAILAAQHAVAMHDFAHAAGHKESTPGKSTCDKCFACAELSSAVGTSIPPVALPDLTFVPAHDRASAPASSTTLLAYRSQAPPALLF